MTAPVLSDGDTLRNFTALDFQAYHGGGGGGGWTHLVVGVNPEYATFGAAPLATVLVTTDKPVAADMTLRFAATDYPTTQTGPNELTATGSIPVVDGGGGFISFAIAQSGNSIGFGRIPLASPATSKASVTPGQTFPPDHGLDYNSTAADLNSLGYVPADTNRWGTGASFRVWTAISPASTSQTQVQAFWDGAAWADGVSFP